jgi:hypothetical protein
VHIQDELLKSSTAALNERKEALDAVLARIKQVEALQGTPQWSDDEGAQALADLRVQVGGGGQAVGGRSRQMRVGGWGCHQWGESKILPEPPGLRQGIEPG